MGSIRSIKKALEANRRAYALAKTVQEHSRYIELIDGMLAKIEKKFPGIFEAEAASNDPKQLTFEEHTRKTAVEAVVAETVAETVKESK
jgi:hypothetical protein